MISSYATQNWITLTIVFLVGVLVLIRYLFDDRFLKYISIFKNEEYFVEFLDKKSPFISFFNGLLFFLQLGVYSLLLFLLKSYYNEQEDGFLPFIYIVEILFLFIVSRYLVGKFLAFIFRIDKMQGVLSFVKFTYFSKTAIYIFPFVIISFYLLNYNDLFMLVMSWFVALMLLFFYVRILINNQKIVFRNLFYFILYLCTLEITPLLYFFKVIFKW